VISTRTQPGERLERARSHLGGAGRHDHAARRLPGPLLPGGLPGDRVDPALHEARQGDGRRLGRRVRRALDGEVYKYTVKEQNYGKAARRLYNIFRLTGRYNEAAYIRELFDEPVTALYQVAALLRTLDEAADAHDSFRTDTMVAQVDQLIMSAIAALEGRAEAEMVRRLLRLRDAVSQRAEAAARAEDIAGMQEDAMRAVNEYFERVLTSVPSIKAYLDGVAAAHQPSSAVSDASPNDAGPTGGQDQ
jgi:hypothetical protein